MPVVSTYQITRSATPFKTRGRPPFTPTGLSAGNKGLATSKNSSGIKPVAIAHLLVHGFMRQVCTRKSHAKFGFCQRFLDHFDDGFCNSMPPIPLRNDCSFVHTTSGRRLRQARTLFFHGRRCGNAYY